MNRFFQMLLSVVVALFFLLIGIISLVLPWSPSARTDLVFFILENSNVIALFGLGWLVIGLSILISLILQARHRYYHLRSGPRSVKVDEAIISSYLESYWKRLFPHMEIPQKVTLKRNKIYIAAELPYVPPQEQKILLKKAHVELADLLDQFLGYKKNLSLSASFQPASKIDAN